MLSPSSTPLTIGQMARRSGLTVRTLHHYEAIGLLVPCTRTAAGHRRYGPAEVERVQQIVSLRALGLPLRRIRVLLDGGLSVQDALDEQVRHLRRKLSEGRALLAWLEQVAVWYARGQAVAPDDLFHLISLSTMFDTHYTPEQRAALRNRAEAIGPDALADVQQHWADLFAHLDALRVAGVAPDAPDAQALARRGQALIARFTGGDAGIRQSLARAVTQEPQQAYQAWGIAPELGAYWQRVMDAA